MKIIKKFLGELKYIILNCITCFIPFWPLRWCIYKAFGMKIGRGSRILLHTRVYAPENIVIGQRSWINENCYLDGRGGVQIGSDVTIATYTKLITGSHNIDDETFSYSQSHIVIEDNCAVFSDTIVLGGAHLEKGVVISAKSLVRKGNYQVKGIYAGNPAKFIRFRKCSCEYRQSGFVLFR